MFDRSQTGRCTLSTPRRRATPALLLVVGALASLALNACGTTPPSRFYVLTPTAQPIHDLQSARLEVVFTDLTLPAEVDRAQLVVSISPNQRVLSEFDRWAGPLRENLRRVLARNLEAHLGPGSVFERLDGFTPRAAFRLSVEILEFDAQREGPCTLVARFHIADHEGQLLHSSPLRAVARDRSQGAAGIAEAMSNNLTLLGDAIAEALVEARGSE